MFSKSTFLALFTLAVTTFSANAIPLKFETETFCQTATIAISTVVSTVHETHTVTVSSGSQATGKPGSGNNAIVAGTTTTAATATATAKSPSGGQGANSDQGSGNNQGSGKGSNNGKGSNTGNAGKGSNAGNVGKGGNAGNAGKGTTTTSSATAAKTSSAVLVSGGGGGGDLQTSLTLDPNVIQTTGTGQNPPVAGQSEAAVSSNNFINFCSPNLATTPITNGLQLTDGSCNPIPIGNIPSTANIPSSKFQSPINFSTLKANTAFNVTLGVRNIQLGTFTAATETYYANPQTLNAQGKIIGHTHIVIEKIDSLATTQITDPLKFAFFKGVDGGQDANGNVVVPVTAGLAAGVYRMGTIMSSATHQPVIVAVAQHGIVDDAIYFTVTADGAPAAGAGAGNAAAGGNGGNAAVAVSSSAAAVGSSASAVIESASASAVAASASFVAQPASAAPAVATGKAAKGKGGSKNASGAAATDSASAAPAAAASAASGKGKGDAAAAATSAAAAADAASSAAVEASSSAAPAAASAAAADASAGAAAGTPFVEESATAGKAIKKGKALS